jgi:hypothetical protein
MIFKNLIIIPGFFCVLLFLLSLNAYAIPSYARQTNMSCSACHTSFPELTPFGRLFKLGGYTLSKSDKPYEFPPPLSAQAQFSYTNTGKAQSPDTVERDWATRMSSQQNNFLNVPQSLSLFYGGKIYSGIGAFIQGTYDGVDDRTALDTMDIRFAQSVAYGERNLIYGITINNNPTAQDVWNSTPAFGYPYSGSSVAPTPAAAAVIDGSLGGQVSGIGAYLFWDNMIYGEVSVYHSNESGPGQIFKGNNVIDTVLDGVAPYWRIALEHQWDKHCASIGTYGMVSKIFPGGVDSGPSDSFRDFAVDAQYQYIGVEHVFSAQTTWIHENQDWSASFDQGGTADKTDHLNTYKLNLNYYHRGSMGDMGGTLAYFSTCGDMDTGLYPSGGDTPISRTSKPDSSGFIYELNYVPSKWSKITLQYISYNKFDGARSNYDGSGRDASDNNTFYFLLWLII